MVPRFLAGSYERYKQDTALFTTWLAQTAATCGYKPTEIHRQDVTSESAKPGSNNLSGSNGPRLKGKDRKAAKDAAAKENKAKPSMGDAKAEAVTTVKYTVTTRELLDQAKAVAESAVKPRITMPFSLRKVVEKAIGARQRCTEWFQKSKIQNKHSDQQHMHFVKVLEDSLSVLGPCIEDEDSSQQSKKLPKDRENNVSTNLADITNRFERLVVEDTLDVDDVQVSEVIASINTARKTPSSKGKSVIESFELEDESKEDDDLAFRIFCFFEDLHRIQEHIGGLWKGYKAGEIDLHTAAVITNSAFGLVRRSEDEILSIAPKVFNKKRSWDTIAIIIFYADAFEKGVCPEARLRTNESLRITPFDNFIYLSTARILMKFTYLSKAPADFRNNYPVPCFPLRAGYVSRPELLESPEMKKKEEEDLILSQFVIDKSLSSMFRKKSIEFDSGSVPPLEDEFNKGLDKLLNEGVLSVSTVFAAQIYLDLQNIMGENGSKALDDLQTSTKEIDKIMNLKAVNNAWDVGGSGERWHSNDIEIVLRIKSTSLHWVLENQFTRFKELMLHQNPQDDDVTIPLAPAGKPSEPSRSPDKKGGIKSIATSTARPKPPKDPKFSNVSTFVHEIPEEISHLGLEDMNPALEKHLRKTLVESGQLPDNKPVSAEHEENARKLNIRPIKASKDCSLYTKSNPVSCGLLSFNLLTDFEAAGLALCNWQKRIWPTAHLYNALRQTSKLDRRWREMEGFIGLHMDDLFAGQLPLSGIEFYPRFALSLGVSPVMFARNPRRRTDNTLVMRPGVIGTKVKITTSTQIFRQYFEGKASLETCLIQLETLMRDPGRQGTRREREAAKRPLTNLQFLGLLRNHFSYLIPRLQFDYITLTKQCAKILKDVRTRIGLELNIQYPRQDTGDSADQTFPLMVMNVLQDTKELATSYRNSARGGGHALIGPQLDIAGEVIQNSIKTSNPSDLIKNFNELPRNPRAPSGMVPNHWNISIRHVCLNPPGDLVFFVQPDSHYVHTEGPIQTVEGQIPGHKLNPKSLVTLQVISRLIMTAFVQGMGSHAGAQAPWSWSTNDENFARRITKVMKDLGITQEKLLTMRVADPKEIASVDEDWKRMIDTMEAQMSSPR